MFSPDLSVQRINMVIIAAGVGAVVLPLKHGRDTGPGARY